MIAAADVVLRWSHFYASHDGVQLAITCGHLIAITYALSYAVPGDRAALRLTDATRPSRHAQQDITTITRAHRHVLTGLSFAFATGLAQLLAHADYLPQSPIFWSKMLVLAGLLANGRIIQLAGRRIAAEGRDDPTFAARPRQLRAAAIRSLALWGVMILMGLLLTTVKPG